MISPDIEKETRFRYPPFLMENGVRAVANVIIIGGKGRQPLSTTAARQRTNMSASFFTAVISAGLDHRRVNPVRVRAAVRKGEAILRAAALPSSPARWGGE